ncbi:electron transfer flavoprotein subunit alpha/FixB family protein, partial [Falsiroseomonas oryzae]|uniref:electron transfer flavoprotein subunit alpha/FixB family protein n=1 Tax=Falsiroseomonas oryzae TaxID=2766473 RepID=UPI0022EB2D32
DPYAAVAAAAAIAAAAGTRAEALLLGQAEHLDAAAAEAARAGAATIRLVAHAALADSPPVDHLLQLFAAELAETAEPSLLVLPAGAVGEELAARLASRADGVPLGRCAAVAIEGGTVIARRAAYGGRAELVLTSEAEICLAAMHRPGAAPVPVAAPEIRHIVSDATLRGDVPLPEARPAAADRPRRVDAARLVVAGGRGMGGPEGFAKLGELSALLGAATGASLPAVDAGWASVAQQVGQSGAYVAPELYLAVGMSGTPQHLAGVALHSRIAAINPDPEAAIFRFAELGVVAPWQDVLPRLIETLRDG